MPVKAKLSVQPRVSSDNLLVTRLAVTLTRDSGWRDTEAEVRDSLLYIGLDRGTVLQLVSRLNVQNPFGLTELLQVLYKKDKLAEFFTEMIRLNFRPYNPDEFRYHLQPLGLDWYRENNRVQFTTTRPEEEVHLRSVLDTLLAKISTEFPKMLNGAWDAYYSDNPDKYRQTISSCRELLNQVITRLSKSEEEKLNRKEKVRRILDSKHRTELVESAAALVSAIYDAQSAEQHTSADAATALFVLVETEHVLYFLLNQRPEKNK